MVGRDGPFDPNDPFDPLNSIGLNLKDNKELFDEIQAAIKEGRQVFIRKPVQEKKEMRNCTKIVMILDRSGSMESVKCAMEEVMNGYMSNQKQQDGECIFSLVQFDDQYEQVFTNVPVQSVPHIYLRPRGGTALLDAIGITVTNVGYELGNMPEHMRPNKVLIIVITDGFENASREYISQPPLHKAARINDMVRHQREKYSWEFLFLGANQDAITTAAGLGFDPRSVLNYQNTAYNIRGVGSKLSRMSNVYRGAVSASVGTEELQSIATENANNEISDKDCADWDELVKSIDSSKVPAGSTP